MAFESLLDEIRDGIGRALASVGGAAAGFDVSPARPGFGDASSNAAFLLARELGIPPPEAAARLSGAYPACGEGLVARCEAHPSGYLNFSADWARLGGLILSESDEPGYGRADVGGGARVAVEHTSVNPNKALHIGHVRNIVIGDCVSRILAASNHEVSVLNYVDDSGLQVADIMVGFSELGFATEPPGGKKFDHYCGDDVYVATTERYESDPALAAVRDRVLRELEDGSSETARLADSITRRVLAAQLETCWRLSVCYDCLNFESHIVRSGMWGRAFERLREKGLVELEGAGKNAGCWVVRGRGGDEDKVIVRSNGTATYVAKDIPYAAWKLGLVDDPFTYSEYAGQQGGRTLWQTVLGGGGGRRDYSAGRVITVIDSRQARLQGIVASLMDGFAAEPGSYVHLGYESVTLSPGTAAELGMETGGRSAQMSGRRGHYVSADSVYGLLRERAAAETRKRNPGMGGGEVDAVSHSVAAGTLRYEMVRQDLDKAITFDLARSLSLEGDTAPYVQYAHARAVRILEKAGGPPGGGADCGLLSLAAEVALLRTIGLFGARVAEAARNLSPKVVARYCHDLAVAFNAFYEGSRVLGLDDPALGAARLRLVGSFRTTVASALSLIGIDAPDRM